MSNGQGVETEQEIEQWSVEFSMTSEERERPLYISSSDQSIHCLDSLTVLALVSSHLGWQQAPKDVSQGDVSGGNWSIHSI